MANRIINKKQKLLTRKEELLNELKYYEKRIEDARTNKKIPSFYEDDSSDSELEFSINCGTSITELKLEKSQLLTCLRATEELTDVTVLQSEVNVVVTPPTFEGEVPITEDGLWREVMAECRIDLVTFSITFYTHQPCRQFAPVSYRGLSVMPTKLVHEKELTHTVLPTLTAPSDAVEVVRSYAAAHRSRRSSLARLADKYADSLYMETLPEGGYVLKCANLLRASWTLQNKWSPVAPFYHKLTFDLEYMDETYIKKIMQAHKQLCDPALDTDDRTLLLAEIIDTCLEARKQMGPDSDADSQNSKANQKSGVENQNSERPLGQDIDAPVKSSEIMGPPKSLPKKSKAKGKENVLVNERKRGSDGGSEEGTVKKAKTSHSAKDNIDKNSKNSNKKSNASHNVNSKNSSNEEVVENTYFSKNEPGYVDKSNKKPKSFPEIDTKAKNTEVLINSNDFKAKHSAQTKSKPGNGKTDAKSSENIVCSAKTDKNNDNLNTAENKNFPEKELKTKNGNPNKNVASKIFSAEKEPSNLKEKNNANFENIPASQNKSTNPKASSKKNLKTKAETKPKDGNELETKKSKISASTNKKTLANSENVAMQPMKNPDIKELRSKKNNIPEDKEETESIQMSVKNIKNVAKQTQKNIKNPRTKTNMDKNQNENSVSAKNQLNFEQKGKSEKNQGLKKNSNKNVQSKENFKKSRNDNSKNGRVLNPSNKQTLAERFSKNIIVSKNMEEKSDKNSNKNLSPRDYLVQNKAKSNQNKEVGPNLQVIKTKSNINVLKPKITKELNKENPLNIDKIEPKSIEIEKQNNLKILKHMPKINSNDNKLVHNNQKIKKSLGLKKFAIKSDVNAEYVGSKQISKIPQKRFPITKTIMKNPLRISPRKHQSSLSSTQNSSKSSTKSLQKHTNIPRLLKIPRVKQN